MGNLGGHDLPSLVEAFDKAAENDRPTCFICYTIKGSGLALAGHKDNHAGMMTPAQMDQLRESMSIRAGHEWDKFEGLKTSANDLQAFLDRVPFAHERAAPPRRAACRGAGRACRSRSSRRCRRSSASARC